MSTEVSRSRTLDSATDKYDHEIRLVDTTVEGSDGSSQLTPSGSWRSLARNPTQISVKEQLARRKYHSWRKDKFTGEADASAEAEEDGKANNFATVTEVHPDNEESQTVDFGRRPDTGDESGQPKAQEPMIAKKTSDRPDTEVDILYENQRGSFFCGIPLYSHSSLLNFDPAAWVTKDLKNSPVNITNAQVPDPSWMWAWKTWYVDMGYDVDEEGWQYSFSFGRQFAWHGTHPWLYSFVRRRRWLRKRVKRTDALKKKDDENAMEAAHSLNTDYFTIHSGLRGRSMERPTNPEAELPRPVSFTSFSSVDDELMKLEDIKDIPSLMNALRKATIDREKVDAVKFFISNGGDELLYLSEHMPDIMSTLIFQNSRRQILQQLKDQAEAAQQHRNEHDADDRPEGPVETKRIDNLLKAADAANKEIQGLEYWSDRKHVLQTEDEIDDDDDPVQQQMRNSTLGEIKGISAQSETTQELKIDRRLIDKGKQRVQNGPQSDKENAAIERDVSPPLDKDSMLVTEDDNGSTNNDENTLKGQSAAPIQL